MSEASVSDPEAWDSLVVEVLGVEWLTESRFDQLVELVRSSGDPHAAAAELDVALAVRYYEALDAAYRRLREVDA